MAEGAAADRRPAFYAARAGVWRDWWTLLHPPYTLWHLSYVAIGAGVSPRFDAGRFVATVAAFFLAVGVAAHALDELNDRPLRTRISGRALLLAALIGLGGAAAIGVAMLVAVAGDPAFVVIALVGIATGLLLVVAYNIELFGGRLHNDVTFAAAWGAFPALAAYYAQAEMIGMAAVPACGAAFAISYAQRALSNQARFVRRQVDTLQIEMRTTDGATERSGIGFVLSPIEAALRALSWGTVLTGAALIVARLLNG